VAPLLPSGTQLSWTCVQMDCLLNNETTSRIFVFHSIDFQEVQMLFSSSASTSVHFRSVVPGRQLIKKKGKLPRGIYLPAHYFLIIGDKHSPHLIKQYLLYSLVSHLICCIHHEVTPSNPHIGSNHTCQTHILQTPTTNNFIRSWSQ
jgi:hypothetical protein